MYIRFWDVFGTACTAYTQFPGGNKLLSSILSVQVVGYDMSMAIGGVSFTRGGRARSYSNQDISLDRGREASEETVVDVFTWSYDRYGKAQKFFIKYLLNYSRGKYFSDPKKSLLLYTTRGPCDIRWFPPKASLKLLC